MTTYPQDPVELPDAWPLTHARPHPGCARCQSLSEEARTHSDQGDHARATDCYVRIGRHPDH